MGASQLYVVVVEAITAGVFFALAASLVVRSVRHEDGRIANAAFALWWFALGIQETAAAVRLPLAIGDMPLSLVIGIQFVTVASISFGMAGLLTYLLYLVTGRAVASWPIFLFYSAFAGWVIRSFIVREATGYDVTNWGVSIRYAVEAAPNEILGLLLVLVGPQLVAILALVMLASRLPHSASRVRLLVVAISIALWFMSATLATGLGVDDDPWQAIRVVIPLLVGVSVLSVYRPPRWLQRRLPPEIAADRAPGDRPSGPEFDHTRAP
jgi:hypothetical protein